MKRVAKPAYCFRLANIPKVERAFSVMLPPDERPSHRRSRSSSASRNGSQAAGGANRPRSHSRGRLYSQDVGPGSGIDAALDLKEPNVKIYPFYTHQSP